MLRWHTSPQGATAALHAALRLAQALDPVPAEDLPDEVVDAYNDFIAARDEHFTFVEVQA